MTGLLDAVTAVLVGGIVVTLVTAVRRDNGAAVVNAAVSLAAALAPTAIAFVVETVQGSTIYVDPSLPAWIAAAGLLHSIGMLGPYDTVWWWDHLTHFLSAALIAALAYAGFLVMGQTGVGLDPSFAGAALLTVGLTMVAGVLWELVELLARAAGEVLDVEPVLVHYGIRDTAFDLAFDLLGAVAVVLLDVRLFVPTAQQSAATTATVLSVVGGLLVVGTVILGGVVALVDRPAD